MTTDGKIKELIKRLNHARTDESENEEWLEDSMGELEGVLTDLLDNQSSLQSDIAEAKKTLR